MAPQAHEGHSVDFGAMSGLGFMALFWKYHHDITDDKLSNPSPIPVRR